MQTQGILEYVRLARIVFWCLFCFAWVIPNFADAATIHTYRDTVSDSDVAAFSNHTVSFETTVAIPQGGYIRFTPSDGDFFIPMSTTTFDMRNVELFVNDVLRPATSTGPTTNEDGVTIVRGASGSIEVTLNSTTGIAAGSQIELRIGTHTSSTATSTDTGIANPTASGTYPYHIRAGDGGTYSEVTGRIAIIESISVGPVDTTETDPPIIFNGRPTGTISGTTLVVQVSVETNEFAKCRYSNASGTLYANMGNELSNTFTVIHYKELSVATNTTYSLYIRCIDDEGNANTEDYLLSFTVPEFPEGVPGEEGEVEGEGEGTGEGDGDTDDGSGSPTGDDASSGGTSGGGSGGGGGGGSGQSSGGDGGSGGFEGTDRPYQSGDARVTIRGYAFPRSTVVILVDGKKADQVTANATGVFESVLDEIARGAYSFGVYGIDDNGVKSSTFSTTFTVTGGRASTLSNINVMPSILVDPNPVDPGAPLTISGYSIPNAAITIENQKDTSSVTLKTFTTTSDSDGAWSISVDTSSFTPGTYKVRAKAKQSGGLGIGTEFSGFVI
jgi:hypothetical protein